MMRVKTVLDDSRGKQKSGRRSVDAVEATPRASGLRAEGALDALLERAVVALLVQRRKVPLQRPLTHAWRHPGPS